MGVVMVIPTVLVATVLSQLVGAGSSTGSTMAIAGFIILALFFALYFIFAAIYSRFGGHRDECGLTRSSHRWLTSRT